MEISFIAIDFETATNSRMACQLGMVVVRNGNVEERKEYLIQPPDNYFDSSVMKYHHVKPSQTQHQPTFCELWPELCNYFTTFPIFAHNAAFDQDVLYKNLSYYNIPSCDIQRFQCTCKAFDNTSLMHLCAGFDIPYDANQHHSALYDAERCADFAMRSILNIEPDWNKIAELKQNKSKNKNMHFGHAERIHGDLLVKDLTGADPQNPFYDKKVVITGVFDLDRIQLATLLKTMGADINTSISKKTDIVLIGENPGPVKLKKIAEFIEDGYNIRRMNEGELMEIIATYTR